MTSHAAPYQHNSNQDEEDKQTRSIGDGIFEDHMPIDGLPEIFRITAVEVRDYLYSSEGGKDFTIDSLPNEAKRIVCVVNLNHSLIDSIAHNLDERIYVGVCYYGYNHQYQEYTYIAVYSHYIPYELLGVQHQVAFSIADTLDSGVTYYSFIKTRCSEGFVHGTLTLCYSCVEE